MWESPVTTVLEFPVFIFHSFPPMTSTFLQISIKFSTSKLIPFHGDIFRKPTLSFSPLESKFASFQQRSFKLGAYRERWSFLGGRGFSRNGVLLEDEGGGRKKRVVLVKNNQGFGFNGGGGERDDRASARILGNLALAIGLAYLSTTGQLGWLGSILDAIVSIWVSLSPSWSALRNLVMTNDVNESLRILTIHNSGTQHDIDRHWDTIRYMVFNANAI